MRRYGVVFRSARPRNNLPRWRELQIGYRRLEDRGECAVDALSMAFRAKQFACPSQSNRCAPAQAPAHANAERIVIGRADPLKLVGIVVPGERIPPSPARASPSATPLEPKTRSKPPALTRRRRDLKCRLASLSTRMPHPFAPLRRWGFTTSPAA